MLILWDWIIFIEKEIIVELHLRVIIREREASVCVHSILSDFVAPHTVAWQAPLFMRFSSQEYWSGLSFPTSGNLPHPGIKPISLVSPPLAAGFFTTHATCTYTSEKENIQNVVLILELCKDRKGRPGR